MRRILIVLVVAAGLTFGIAAPASAHTDAEANAVCDWFEVLTWGAPNGIWQVRNDAVHLWGRHQAWCVYDNLNWPAPEHWCLLYDFGNGYAVWYEGCLR